MSNIYDAQGNLLNNPGPGCGRYKDDNATTIDWFDTHPRPVEKVAETVSPVAPVSPVVETPVEPTAPVAAALTAGNTTSNLPQTAVASE